MQTLPDLLSDTLNVLSIGLNPSTPSVKAGFYFANPRNRFWQALNGCGYFSEALTPNLKSCQHLLTRYRIGFTDLVKRPTAGCKELTAQDYRQGCEQLQRHIAQLKPRLIWFHGKLTCKKYIQYSADKSRSVCWGEQDWQIKNAAVIVTPNPSSANAAYSLQAFTESYQILFKRLPEGVGC